MAHPGQPRGPVEIKDLGIGRLRKQIAAMQSSEITIGWQGASGREVHPGTDASNATVAAWMEFGTKRMPARPALRVAFERNREAFVDAARKAIADVIDMRSDGPEQALDGLGTYAVTALRDTIDDARAWAEPLAPRTVQAKGHDQPWLDTGTLRDAASYAVRRDGVIVQQGGEE